MKKFWMLPLLLISQISWARSATEFGNGGNAVVCPRSDGDLVMTYDMMEAVHRYNLIPRFPPIVSADCHKQKNGREICWTGTDIAEKIVLRLKKLDPAIEANLQLKLKKFWSEATLMYTELETINDSGLNFVLEGCHLKQLAIQHVPVVADDSRYFISGDLWRDMSSFDKAVLILHEIIYHYALEANPKLRDSQRVRYFNALLFSDKISSLTKEQYQAIKLQTFKR